MGSSSEGTVRCLNTDFTQENGVMGQHLKALDERFVATIKAVLLQLVKRFGT